MRRTVVCVGLLSLAAGVADAGAQDFDGGLGATLAALGDLDGDGSPEFAAGSRGDQAQVVVYSAKTCTKRWSVDGWDAAAVPDQDADGVADVAVAQGFTREPDRLGRWATVYSGKTGREIRGLTLGPDRAEEARRWRTERIHSLGDVDGDGKLDLLMVRAAALGSTYPGDERWCDELEAHVVTVEGKHVKKLEADGDNRFSRSVLAAPAGDLDGDGRIDLFVAWRDAGKGKLPLRALSVTKGVLREYVHAGGSLTFDAVDVDPIGDLDGDGVADLLYGNDLGSRGAKSFSGEVRVLSGKNGAFVRAAKGAHESASLGKSIAVLPDLDGDGLPDFAAGEPGYDGQKKAEKSIGAVRSFSGKTAKPIWVCKGTVPMAGLGTCVETIGDVDGDGVPDLAASGASRIAPRVTLAVVSGKTGAVISKTE
jgi:hypothetical protein